MEDKDWFSPENLKKAETADIKKIEDGIADSSTVGDFGAYHRLLKQRRDDWVRSHAIIDPHEADLYAKQAVAAAEAAGPLPLNPSLLDAGCGPGTITEALRLRFRCARATGIDISTSAIQYANEEFPQCRFKVIGIDKNTPLPETYDVIHAREFYPFTRTGDLAIHAEYLKRLSLHLKPGGVLILAVLAREETLAKNTDRLAASMRDWGLAPFLKIPSASGTVLRTFHSISISRNLILLIGKFLRRPIRYFYVSRNINRSADPRDRI